MIKQRWTSLLDYVCKRNGIQIHWTALCWLKQLISLTLNSYYISLWCFYTNNSSALKACCDKLIIWHQTGVGHDSRARRKTLTDDWLDTRTSRRLSSRVGVQTSSDRPNDSNTIDRCSSVWELSVPGQFRSPQTMTLSLHLAANFAIMSASSSANAGTVDVHCGLWMWNTA